MISTVLFWLIASFVLLCSLMVVTSRNPVSSAVFLVTDLFFIAALFAQMNAHFIAAIQVLLYAGAIVVLFVFVIMLLNLKKEELQGARMTVPEIGVLLVSIIGFLVIAGLLGAQGSGAAGGEWSEEAIQQAGGNTVALAMRLFTNYVWPFELASVLILLAIVAAVVIAKKDNASGSTDASGGSNGPR
jgi:NADH-quinone oxidoreductase subunit J